MIPKLGRRGRRPERKGPPNRPGHGACIGAGDRASPVRNAGCRRLMVSRVSLYAKPLERKRRSIGVEQASRPDRHGEPHHAPKGGVRRLYGLQRRPSLSPPCHAKCFHRSLRNNLELRSQTRATVRAAHCGMIFREVISIIPFSPFQPVFRDKFERRLQIYNLTLSTVQVFFELCSNMVFDFRNH